MITQAEIEKDFIDSPEAARLLGISDSRIRRLCLDNRFQGAIKAGKSWLIPKIAVENFERLPRGAKTREQIDRETLTNAIKEANNLKDDDNNDKQ